jgi:hypothetical protein
MRGRKSRRQRTRKSRKSTTAKCFDATTSGAGTTRERGATVTRARMRVCLCTRKLALSACQRPCVSTLLTPSLTLPPNTPRMSDGFLLASSCVTLPWPRCPRSCRRKQRRLTILQVCTSRTALAVVEEEDLLQQRVRACDYARARALMCFICFFDSPPPCVSLPRAPAPRNRHIFTEYPPIKGYTGATT